MTETERTEEEAARQRDWLARQDHPAFRAILRAAIKAEAGTAQGWTAESVDAIPRPVVTVLLINGFVRCVDTSRRLYRLTNRAATVAALQYS